MANNWTYNEHILAFNLYCKIPFTKINESYEPVKVLAKVLGRTNGSVAMKLANFARLDPALQARNISGLTRGAKGEETVWNEFNGNWSELSLKSEQILATFRKESLEHVAEIETDDIDVLGKERDAIVKVRVNQSFFRKTILASYNYRCCITGLNTSELLVASHIIPWSVDELNRVNPCNGLCLNSLHDKAFDLGLITITTDFRIQVSDILMNKKDGSEIYFLPFNNKEIRLPQKFYPDPSFLEWHNKTVFKNF